MSSSTAENSSLLHRLLPALLPPLLVLFVHYATFHIYTVWPDYDVVTHFLGGCSIAVSWSIIRRVLDRDEPRWYGMLTTIAMVGLAAVLWEFSEFLMDRNGLFLGGFVNQPSIADTMGDLFFGLLGGTAVAAFTTRRR